MRVHLESPEKPDSVIKLLKNYGLNETHISQLVKKCPILLIYNADKTLLPKLEFFSSIGLSGTDLARIFRFNANILTLSLDASIRPCYDIMKTLQIPQEKIPYFISNYHLFNAKLLTNVARNIPVLKAHDVPQSSFPLWVPLYFTALAFDSEKVKANVKRVMSMGFLPSSTTFMRALYVISVTDASKWEQKMEFYNKWGWTEHDVLLAFRKNPLFIAFSEKNVSPKMEFFLNKMGCQPADLAGRPDILTYSLEKRIIPRCSVIRLLQLKGLIVKEDVSINTILQKSEKWFLKRFVIKYQEQVPELLSIYEEKISLAKFDLGLHERGGVRQL
jgi:mTERF domain-containing protein